MKARWLMLASVLTLAAGCSSDKSPTASTTTTTAPAGQGATSVPSSVPNDPNLRSGVQIGECKAAPNGWEASGSALNPTAQELSLTITVFFTDASATVLATGDTHVVVKAGGREAWSVRKTFAAPVPTLCVLRGVG